MKVQAVTSNKKIIFAPKEIGGQPQTVLITNFHLGSGAYGQVKFGYDAQDPKKVYAIKIIEKQLL